MNMIKLPIINKGPYENFKYNNKLFKSRLQELKNNQSNQTSESPPKYENTPHSKKSSFNNFNNFSIKAQNVKVKLIL
jgi:hypothetical protein